MKRRNVLAVGSVLALGALGGTALATNHAPSLTGSSADDQVITGSKADQARAAALRYTHGGTAGIVEPDNEAGATWGVEVTKPDGAPVDVRVDSNYRLVNITSNADG